MSQDEELKAAKKVIDDVEARLQKSPWRDSGHHCQNRVNVEAALAMIDNYRRLYPEPEKT